MMYQSTRNTQSKVSAAQAIARGISPEGGLFVPENLPVIDAARLSRLGGLDYTGRAADILGDFLTDFTKEEIEACVKAAYGSGKFDDDKPAHLAQLGSGVYMLELWHGPTCAFKDMALQLLPHLLTLSAKKTAGGRKVAILVATSGDTGKAALEGFKNVDGTKIFVFYPKQGVSEIQRLQMATQEGENIGVCAVDGNFDDAQTGVKRIFTDTELNQKLEAENMMFSSANSINWGRLVPQICYYVSAYCDLVAEGGINAGDKVNVCVPTGNFGNILAAYYAKKMGVPFGKLICASNVNNVITDFMRTGVYNRRREFFTTASPSMDILVSSNLERLLFELYGGDDAAVSALMSALANDGVYKVADNVWRLMSEEFYADFCDEDETGDTIRNVFKSFGYLCDTHTAVGLCVADKYRRATGDQTKLLVASTANPYKFAGSILRELTGEKSTLDEFGQAKELSRITSTQIPPQILEIANKPVRFEYSCGKDGMAAYVCEQLGL